MQTVVWQNLILLYHLPYITFTTPHYTRWGGQFQKTNDMIWTRPSLVEELSPRKIDPALVWKKRLMKVLPYLFKIDVKLGQRWCWCHHGIISSNWSSALWLFQNGTLQACGVHQEGTFQCQQWHLQVFHPHIVCSQPRKKHLQGFPTLHPSRASPVKTSEISIDLVSEEDTVKFFLNIWIFEIILYQFIRIGILKTSF